MHAAQRQLLAAMGIDVYTLRRTPSSTDLPSDALSAAANDMAMVAVSSVASSSVASSSVATTVSDSAAVATVQAVTVELPKQTSPAPPVASAAPPNEADEQPIPVEPIRFRWVYGGRILCLHQITDDQLAGPFFGDVVASWPGPSAGEKKPSVKRGDFQWPQLRQTTDTPERVLAAFFDKWAADPSILVVLEADTAQRLAPWWRPQTPWLTVASWREVIFDVSAKRALWKELRSRR